MAGTDNNAGRSSACNYWPFNNFFPVQAARFGGDELWYDSALAAGVLSYRFCDSVGICSRRDRRRYYIYADNAGFHSGQQRGHPRYRAYCRYVRRAYVNRGLYEERSWEFKNMLNPCGESGTRGADRRAVRHSRCQYV